MHVEYRYNFHKVPSDDVFARKIFFSCILSQFNPISLKSINHYHSMCIVYDVQLTNDIKVVWMKVCMVHVCKKKKKVTIKKVLIQRLYNEGF